MPSPQPNDLLLRMAAERRLQLAEARVETAARQAIAGWLTAVQAAILDQATPTMTAAGYGWDANAVDAANEFNAWRQGLDAHLLPTVAIVFGEAFQSLRRTDPTSSLAAQQQFMADVSDRLRIWPQGAFEEIRPDLLEALSDAATFEEMKDRIGAILSVDTQTRDLRAQISDVDKKLADPDLPDWRRDSLTARRAALWNAHDESLSGWEWKARRIARTEAHAAIEAGQLARARAVEEETGDVYYKRWLCVPGDTRVAAFGTTHVARRHYEGPAITIRTASGRSVTLTPQHEVLTGRGWIPAQEVRKEDHLFHVGEGDSVRAPDIERGDPMIAEVFDATVAAKPVEVRPVPAGVDLDSERSTEQYVHVELVDRALADDLAEGLQRRGDFSLVDADGLAQVAGFSRGDTYRFVGGPLVPGNTCEGDGALPCFDFGSFAAGAGESGGRSIADGDATVLQYPSDNLLAASDGACYFGSGDPGLIEADDVVLIEVSAFCGHVYDLSTVGEWFAADSLIVHNSTEDSRTRPTHVVADGQMVRLGEKFRVGGFLLDFPGDPITIAPQETIQCRCSTAYLDIDAAQAEVQGPKGSLGAVVPGGRRFGPDDPDDARAAVEQVAADRNQQAPADQRGEDFGQVQPDVAPITPPVTPDAPVIDAPDDLTGLSDDQLIELMIAAGNANNDVLFERVDAEFDRRSATIDTGQDTTSPGATPIPADLTNLSDDQLVDLLFAASDADITRIETELDRRNGTGFTASALVAAVRRTTFDEAKHARDARGQFAHTNTRADHFENPPFRRFTRKWPATRSSDVTPRVAGDIREDYRKWLDHRNDMRRRQLGQTTPAGFDRDTLGRTTADYDMQGVVDDTLASGLNAHFINDGEADDADLDVMADAMWQILDRNHRSATPQADAAVNDVVHTTKRPDATGADAVTALDDLDAALGRLHQMRSGDFTPDPDWSSWLVYDGTTQRAPNAAFDRQSFYDNTDAGKIGAAIAKSGLNVRGIGHPDVSRDTQRQIVEQLERMSDRAVVASAGPANPLARYWTRGEGLARWAGSPHPYTTLVEELSREIDTMTPDQIHGLAANYYHAVFGRWPGHDTAVTAAGNRVDAGNAAPIGDTD